MAAADAGTGAQTLRTTAVVRLLLHNALRDEACAADIAEDFGHRVLRVVRMGPGTPLPPYISPYRVVIPRYL